METAWGESVFLVGDAPELGGWDLAHAVPMNPTDYPVWRAALELDTAHGTAFKLIKVDEQGSVTWQSGGNQTLPAGAREWAGSW